MFPTVNSKATSGEKIGGWRRSRLKACITWCGGTQSTPPTGSVSKISLNPSFCIMSATMVLLLKSHLFDKHKVGPLSLLPQSSFCKNMLLACKDYVLPTKDNIMMCFITELVYKRNPNPSPSFCTNPRSFPSSLSTPVPCCQKRGWCAVADCGTHW